MIDIVPMLNAADKTREEALERLFQLLSIPSISADPAHADDVVRAAEWLANDLKTLGFSASVRPTSRHPIVVGHSGGKAASPHVLFYGHYDVQPVAPLDQWRNPPFAPKLEVKDGVSRILGRGAADDKGQLMTFLEALRACKAALGEFPFPVTVLLEGEEEIGSPSLESFLQQNRDELARDVVLICDTNMIDGGIPAIVTMLRGIVHEELTLRGPSRDLHSGYFGGLAVNPLHVLSKVLAALHDDQGRVAIPGFYDGVDPLPDAVAADWARLPYSGEALLASVGLSESVGEKGCPTLHHIWARPTAEVNGLWGGYTGPGGKTVIPAEAHAKLSFRLVGRQNPDAVVDAFRAFVQARLPKDCTVEFHPKEAGHAASVVSQDNPWLDRAKTALAEEWGVPAATIGSGGSIPIVGSFKSILGMDSLLIGFSYDDDSIHAPNEKFDLTCFQKGVRSWIRILAALGERQPVLPSPALPRVARACNGESVKGGDTGKQIR